MVEQETNAMATASLGMAIGLIASYLIGVCVGMVPFIGLVAIVLYPIDWLLALGAVGTGILGIRRAGEIGGEGKPQAIIGTLVGTGFVLLQLLVFGLLAVALVFAVVADQM